MPDIENAPSTSAVLTMTVLEASSAVFSNGFEVDSLFCPIE
jgi:hypothetical protein